MTPQIALIAAMDKIAEGWPSCPDCGESDCWVFQMEDEVAIHCKCKHCGSGHMFYK